MIFFLVLTAILAPILIVARQFDMDVPISLQAVIILVASYVCQLLRRQPLSEVTGKFNIRWIRDLGVGCVIGLVLMLVPAFIMRVCGWIDWQLNPIGVTTLLSSGLLFVSVAVAEESLFRGFIFQRFIAGLGQWPAQLIMAGYFVITHLNNPGMTGSVKIMASVNIFLASIMFGIAFIRTRSLAMPLGLHFMANWVQGGILGLGVSGTEQTGLLKPIFSGSSDWLTGGQFGLEASVFGLISVVVTVILLYNWQPSKDRLFIDNAEDHH